MMETVTSDSGPSDSAASDPALPSRASRVLRPSRQAYARAVRANVWIAVPLLAISLVRIAINPWLLPVFAVALVAVFGGVLLYFRYSKVEYGEGTYRVTNSIGSVRRFDASEVSRVVTVASLNSGSTAPPAPQLILTRPEGTKLLRLSGRTWDITQFTELATDLITHGVVNDAILEPITTAQLRARYPRVVGWWEAHPIAFGLILGVGILALAGIVVVAVFVASYA